MNSVFLKELGQLQKETPLHPCSHIWNVNNYTILEYFCTLIDNKMNANLRLNFQFQYFDRKVF